MKTVSPFEVYLSNRGKDFRQNQNRRLPGTPADHWSAAVSLDHAAALCRAYIETFDLGGGNWTGGQVRDASGAIVARVSYNGRILEENGPCAK